MFLPACLPVCLSVCLTACLSVCLSVCLLFTVSLPACLPPCLSRLSKHDSECQTFDPLLMRPYSRTNVPGAAATSSTEKKQKTSIAGPGPICAQRARETAATGQTHPPTLPPPTPPVPPPCSLARSLARSPPPSISSLAYNINDHFEIIVKINYIKCGYHGCYK